MRIRVFILGLLLAASTQAQLLYRDASVFPLLGKATDATLTRDRKSTRLNSSHAR